MFVAIDKITAVRMYNFISDAWQAGITELEKGLANISDDQERVIRIQQIAWMRKTEMAVVVSDEQNEIKKFKEWGLDIIPHRKRMKNGFVISEVVGGREIEKRLDVKTAFKREDHPFRIVIVCAMWLTGFDVPSLSTLYLDKPLQAHTLMQAIARANRVKEGKNNGLIVDYCGILKNLRKALATFAGNTGGRGPLGEGGDEPIIDPLAPQEALLGELAESERKASDVQDLRNVLEERLAKMLAANPTLKDFQIRFGQIINDYNKEKYKNTIEATFEALMRITVDLEEEAQSHVALGLTQEQKPIYDLLYDDKTGLPVSKYNETDLDEKTDVLFQHFMHSFRPNMNVGFSLLN